MHATAALLTGLVAGLAIAMQVGAVSLLLIETAIARGPRAGVAAGMGVATADFGFAVVAVLAGGTVGAALSGHEAEIKIAAALVLGGLAIHGLLALRRGTTDAASAAGPARGRPAEHYARFLAITSANPLTIVSFAAVAAALSVGGPAAALAFALGVGAASAGWHLVLTLAAGHAGRWITPRIRHGLAIGGRLLVLAIAARLALGA